MFFLLLLLPKMKVTTEREKREEKKKKRILSYFLVFIFANSLSFSSFLPGRGGNVNGETEIPIARHSSGRPRWTRRENFGEIHHFFFKVK